MSEARKIIVVDDEAQMRKALYAVLNRKGYDVVTVPSGADALAALTGANGFSAVISDVRMPGMTGLELLRSVKKLCPALPVIMMTAYGTIDTAIEAMREGAEDYVLKPFSSEIIESALARALARGAGEAEPGIATKSEKMLKILELAKNIAPTTATVLITGESGTGKELLARFIHSVSDRADKPFVTVNCAAIPDGLLESELFGHEKGSFTGASSARVGKFEQADGGTLLLDEIGDMGRLLQTKLLRALQEREIDRVGGREPIKIDIRIIATTNIDLMKAVDESIFREDLFYRLNVFPFIIPPLRERSEDVPLLCEFFLKIFSEKYKKPCERISPEAAALLAKNPWRGNVRELENVMERSVLLSSGEEIEIKDIYYGDEKPPEVSAESALFGGTTSIREMERALIFKVLEETAGNRTKAAVKLGISIRTLRNKLNEYADGSGKGGK